MHEAINQLIRNILKTQKPITPHKRLVEDLGFDSLKLMEFIAGLDDDYGISIPLKRVEGIKTVGDVHVLVGALLQERQGE